jgi:hypothetical protein
MSYKEDIDRFTFNVSKRVAAVSANAAFKVHESITVGSALTGAPGQPVDTNTLLSSWAVVPQDLFTWLISTNVRYARNIEYGISRWGTPITIRSAVGGIGSVRLTRTAWPRIVDDAVREEGGAP